MAGTSNLLDLRLVEVIGANTQKYPSHPRYGRDWPPFFSKTTIVISLWQASGPSLPSSPFSYFDHGPMWGAGSCKLPSNTAEDRPSSYGTNDKGKNRGGKWREGWRVFNGGHQQCQSLDSVRKEAQGKPEGQEREHRRQSVCSNKLGELGKTSRAPQRPRDGHGTWGSP